MKKDLIKNDEKITISQTTYIILYASIATDKKDLINERQRTYYFLNQESELVGHNS